MRVALLIDTGEVRPIGGKDHRRFLALMVGSDHDAIEYAHRLLVMAGAKATMADADRVGAARWGECVWLPEPR